MIKTITYMVLCCLAIFCDGAYAKTIVDASTETATAGEITPPKALVDSILTTADENDLATFLECVRDINKDDNKVTTFFRAVQLPTTQQIGVLFFVRPALEPYCLTLYGAHVFQYWIVREAVTQKGKSFDVRYRGVADRVEILSSQHKSYPDIVETNCWAMGCGSATLQYDGAKYVATDCKEMTINKDGSETTKAVFCPKAYTNGHAKRN